MSAYGPNKYDFTSVQKVYDFLDSCFNSKTESFDEAAKRAIAHSRQLYKLDFSERVNIEGGKSTLLELAISQTNANLFEFLCSQGINVNLSNKGFNIFAFTKIKSLLQALVDMLDVAVITVRCFKTRS